MTSPATFANAAAICGVLHNLYFHKPTPAFLANFRDSELLASWPLLASEAEHQQALALISQSLAELTDEQIERDYYRLFVGPGEMLAYPWGSVYTDKENLLFGVTSIAFSQFLKRWQIELQLDSHQPLDHAGLMLGVLSQLLQGQHLQAVDELLSQHLMPWAPRWLACIEQGADSGFYRGMAQLTAQVLNALMQAQNLTADALPLYK
ncbi:TorD/DmsD family molecular chaperone [Ferrimonas senticii]|uniref:TorD/DmsD family molecular chaperone n=1 Tax=Ferrimonas senticii TaxID=394566 RepID=UPI00042A1DA1|nr:molecular chaperone TorD family protein [Ferrimonas senticii]